jgi:starch phosphorylase
MKSLLFKTVADQCGKLFNENILTIVWARRFVGYKRADLVMYEWERFVKLLNNTRFPVQVIWAGKPYPGDQDDKGLFNHIMATVKSIANCAVLTGYELALSAQLKKGADVWLNNPRMYHEASGTSGMSAAMNGAVNVSLPDGWVPEFAKDGENCFVIRPAPESLSIGEKDTQEASNLMDALENRVLPMYYNDQAQWLSILKRAAADIVPAFEAGRLADEYYEKMYNV